MSRSVAVDPSQRAPGGAAAPPLTESSLAADPVSQFAQWLSDASAAGLPEPTAMVLATASSSGAPRARTVLLKGYGPEGFIFYTNKTSRKGRELAENPRACLLFPWHAMRRQVIVEGSVSELGAESSERYFHSRPRGSQIGAWASRQSTVLATRSELDDRYEKLASRWPEGTEVPMPGFWGGYLVTHELAEFWQGRENRLHDRLRYRRHHGEWIIERLAP
jgi:pyridoxamine 5'-phosphate oxidase